MARVIAILGLLLIIGVGLIGLGRADSESKSLEIKYRYLIVSIEAPAAWEKAHAFSIQWQGKTVPLPVAFRIPGPAENYSLGAGPEQLKYLKIGKDKLPVTAKPDTQFRVGNELGFAIIPEKSSRPEVVAFSLATWVAVSPPEQPGAVGPDLEKDEMKRAGNKLEKRLKELIAAGRVIDLQPDR